MKKERGQAALEFLMSYGWAILFAIVMIGTLSYYGVLNPTMLLPEKCVLGAEIGCSDYIFNSYTGTVILDLVPKKTDVLVQEIEITGKDVSCKVTDEYFPLTELHNGDKGAYIKVGERRTLTVPCDTLTSNTGKFRSDVSIKYQEVGPNKYSHTLKGEILTKTETLAWPTRTMCGIVSTGGYIDSQANTITMCKAYQDVIPPEGNFKGFGCECRELYGLCSTVTAPDLSC